MWFPARRSVPRTDLAKSLPRHTLGGDLASRVAIGPNDSNYDLAAAYRIYPKVSKAAQNLPFGDDKLRQAEICLGSFRNSLGSLRVKLWAILDGCPEEYRTLFERYFAAKDVVFINLNSVGNRATYAKQLEILLSQRDAEYVYFAEDDYLYLPHQFPRMLSFLRDGQGVDFVTPYDHPDCYELDLHREPKWVTVFEGHHWRTASSTCLTFLTRKSTLAKYERAFQGYSGRNDDCPLWLSLTKRRVFNPFAAIRYLVRREFYRKILPKAWVEGWPQILFGKKAKLWVPLPGVATHLHAGLLSPGFDWLSFMRSEASRTEVLQAVGTAPTGEIQSDG
jgi:hypothetical protein